MTYLLRPLLAVLLLSISLDGSSAEETDRPNIILIMADDLGYGSLGSYGQQKIETPNLDRLAEQGMRFTQAYAGSHVCQPSRSVLMTGLHTGHTACRANSVNQLLLPEDITIAEVLRERGYSTGLFGKWGLGNFESTGDPSKQGFDEYCGQLEQVHAHFYYPAWIWQNGEKRVLEGNVGKRQGEYVTDVIHQEALDFIKRNQDGPFFAYIPTIIPHVELTVPEDSMAPYRGKFPKISIQDPREGYLGSEDGLATYAGMISRLDRQVGELMKLLEELNIADETILIFTSDNGAQWRGKDGGWTKMTDFFEANGKLRGHKGTFYEGGLRVPLIVRWPGVVEAGSTTDLLFGFQDFLPTIAEATGAKTPDQLDGLSVVPTLTGQQVQTRSNMLYWEYPTRNGFGRAARLGKWKVVQPGPKAAVELYDLEQDLGEQNDLAKTNSDVVKSLVQRMDQAHSDARPDPVQRRRPTIDDFVY